LARNKLPFEYCFSHSAFLSASILGSVTTIIIKLYQGAEELKEMKQSIDDFIKHHRISKQLARQMQESFDHEWKNTKGIDMNSILKTFPECIQADICLHLNRELLNSCLVFEDASEGRNSFDEYLSSTRFVFTLF
jgi:hypothetical protein